jgi:hypothetical protein
MRFPNGDNDKIIHQITADRTKSSTVVKGKTTNMGRPTTKNLQIGYHGSQNWYLRGIVWGFSNSKTKKAKKLLEGFSSSIE